MRRRLPGQAQEGSKRNTYARHLRANRTRRIRLSARGLARGDYRFRLVVRSGRSVTRSTLLSVRL